MFKKFLTRLNRSASKLAEAILVPAGQLRMIIRKKLWLVLVLSFILTAFIPSAEPLQAVQVWGRSFSRKRHSFSDRRSNNLVSNRDLINELPKAEDIIKNYVKEHEDEFSWMKPEPDFNLSELRLNIPHLVAGLDLASELNAVFDDLEERVKAAYLRADPSELTQLYADWSISFPAPDFFLLSTDFASSNEDQIWVNEVKSYLIDAANDKLYSMEEFLAYLGIPQREFELQLEASIIELYSSNRIPSSDAMLFQRSHAAFLLDLLWAYDWTDPTKCLLKADEFDHISISLTKADEYGVGEISIPWTFNLDLIGRDFAENPDYLYLQNEFTEINQELPEALVLPLPNVRSEADLDFLLDSLSSFSALVPGQQFLTELSTLMYFEEFGYEFLTPDAADYYLFIPRNRHAVLQISDPKENIKPLGRSVGSTILKVKAEKDTELTFLDQDMSLDFVVRGSQLDQSYLQFKPFKLPPEIRYTTELLEYNGIVNPGAFGQAELDFISKRDLRAELSSAAQKIYSEEFVLQALALPRVDLDFPAARELNEEVDQLAKKILSKIDSNPDLNRYISANYLANLSGDILSLIVFYNLGDNPSELEYEIYNLDLRAGIRIDDHDLLERYTKSRDKFYQLKHESLLFPKTELSLSPAEIQFYEQSAFLRSARSSEAIDRSRSSGQMTKAYAALSCLANPAFKDLPKLDFKDSEIYLNNRNRLFINLGDRLSHLALYAVPGSNLRLLQAAELRPDIFTSAQPESEIFRQIFAELAELKIAADYNWPGYNTGDKNKSDKKDPAYGELDLSSVSAFFIDLGKVKNKVDLRDLVENIKAFEWALMQTAIDFPPVFECLNFSQSLAKIEPKSVGENFYLIIPRDRSASLLLEQRDNLGLGAGAANLIVLAYAGNLAKNSEYQLILRQAEEPDLELNLPLSETAGLIDATDLYRAFLDLEEAKKAADAESQDQAEVAGEVDLNLAYYAPYLAEEWLEDYLR
ncbi:MAG: hypothetical protein Q4P08_03165 [Eubacteriales bacterium]|nr:hypothetical protein [Eubacteriales bacterium]